MSNRRIDNDNDNDHNTDNNDSHGDQTMERTNKVIIVNANTTAATKDVEDKCPCGDPTSHKFDCALYCGQFPCAEKLVKLPQCDHHLHETCLENLLFTRLSKCPLCRSSIDQWRRWKHYQRIEKEISHQFQSDTEEAIRLSRELWQRHNPPSERTRNTQSEIDAESEPARGHRDRRRVRFRSPSAGRSRSRSRSRSRERHRDRNRNNHRESNDNIDRRRHSR